MLTFRTQSVRETISLDQKKKFWSLKTYKQDISFQFPSLTSTPNGAQLVVVEGLRGDENQ